jgi:uncharacterized membrane protein
MAAEPPIALSSLAHLGRRYAVAQVVTVVLAWVLLVAYIASVYPTLPETIPVHFGLNGIPNRYGSKTEMIWLVGVASVFPALNAVFTLKLGRYSKELTALLGFVFVMALMLFAVVVNQIVQAA